MAECALGVSIVKSKTAGRFNWPRFLKSSAIRKKHVNVNHIVAAETYVPIITKASKEMDNREHFGLDLLKLSKKEVSKTPDKYI